MILFVPLFVSLAALVGCASVEIPSIHPHITLPATQNGMWVDTISDEEGEIPAPAWKKILAEKPYIILFSDDWAKLRFTLLKNCLTMDCKNAVGALDFLFETVDQALKKKKVLLQK